MARRKDGWQTRFVDALIENFTIREACRASGIPRQTVYDERRRNPDFDAAIRLADEEITERCEREAYRRAVEGFVESEVRDEATGELVARVTKFSDRMLEMVLKARAPGKYRENVFVENAGTVNHQLSVSIADGQPVEVEPGNRRLAARELLRAGAIDSTAEDL